jgi:hypothetical protein
MVQQSDVVADDQRAPDAGANFESELDAVGSALCSSFRVAFGESELESHRRAFIRADWSAVVHASVLRP